MDFARLQSDPSKKKLYIDQRPEQKTNSQINYRLLLIRIKKKNKLQLV